MVTRTPSPLRQLCGDEGVITTVVGDATTAASHYREWVAAGKHERLVARSEQNLTFKIKPHFSIDAVVIAYGKRLVGETRQLRELSVALLGGDGSYQVLGTVGGGFSEEDRITWHRRLGALEAPSSFRMANSEGTLSRFVRLEVGVEIRCSDLLVSDRFSVGTGLSDAERSAPPAVDSIISFRYQELSDDGVPRFPSYVGIRADVVWGEMPLRPTGVSTTPADADGVR